MAEVLFGLVGRDLSHSFSGNYFADKFRREQLNRFSYELFPMASIGELPELLKRRPNLRGFNVTIPYKEQILPFLSERSPEAEAIGAVNTVVVLPDGSMRGYNTDSGGFADAIEPLLLPTDKRALVLGTGGASKAVCHALKSLNIEATTASRQNLCQSISYKNLTPESLSQFEIIVNATPAGTFPNVDEIPPLPPEGIQSRHLVFDLVYNPAETRLLKTARLKGARTQNGYQMLVNQAEASFALWNARL